MLEQLFGAAAIIRKDTHPNTGGHHHAPAAKLDGVFHALHDALGQVAGFVAAVEAGDHTELIATKACHQVLAAGRGLDMVGNDLEQFIASVVAKAVIDAFEMVDIQEHHRQAAFAGQVLGQAFGEQLVETTAVDQVGQCIVVRCLLQ